VTRVTLDSNIYLSALVFGGKPMQLLEMAVDGEIEVAISDPIIEEIRRHLQKTFGWSDTRVAEAIDTIAAA
jgi:predicted nucleic acid-binding protein